MKAALATAIVLAAFVATAGQAGAYCLELDESGPWRKIKNNCSFGVDFIYDTPGDIACSGWKCSSYVGPGRSVMIATQSGTIETFGCESPGGLGDVFAVHENGRFFCR